MQAEDRAHRIGQKRDVLVLVLVAAGTIEQAILEKAKAKRDIDAKVIQVHGKFVLFYSMRQLRAGSSGGVTIADAVGLYESSAWWKPLTG